MKKITLLILTLLVAAVFCFGVSAEIVASGKCGDDLTWTLDTAGTLTISGTGNMPEWSWGSSAPWFSSRSSITKVVIENGVTSIGDYAFYALSALTSIEIPTSVTSIGEGAFEECCCLTSIELPAGLTAIGLIAFDNCTALESITIDAENEYYSSDERGVLFNKDKTILIKYPAGNENTSYTVPDGVTSIEGWSFSDCTILESLEIPASVTSIGGGVFHWCTALESITVDEENEHYSSDERGVLFNKDKTTLIQYPAGNTSTSYTAPEGVTSIESDAFSDCNSLLSIELPEGLASIGDAACYNCNNLISIEIREGVTSIGYSAFGYCTALMSIEIPTSVTSIGSSAFCDCHRLLRIVLPEGLTSIEGGAFCDCHRLLRIVLPEGLTSIESNAFTDCHSLLSIEIPASVTSIGDYAFWGCTSLATVYYGGSEEDWGVITISDGNDPLISAKIIYNYIPGTTIVASGKCGDDLTWTLDGTGTLAISGTGEMTDWSWEAPWHSHQSSITKVVIEEGVTSIEDGAFEYCHSLLSIEIPASVTSIGSYAFFDCDSLVSIELPEGLTGIGDFAFYECFNLESIEIPEGVTSIGEGAFEYCTSLTSIELPDGLTSIGYYAFWGCTSLATVYYGGSEEDWGAITISDENDPLISAKIIYNYIPTPNISVLGASIRPASETLPQGLRFLTRVNRTNDGITMVEEGTLIIPERLLSGELTLDTEKVLVIKKAANRYYTYAENYYEYTGVLINIPINEYNTKIVARAYAKYTVGDDDTVYTAYSNTLTRSVTDVANAVLADDNADAEVKEAVQLMIDEYSAQ